MLDKALEFSRVVEGCRGRSKHTIEWFQVACFLSFYNMGFMYVLVICNKRNNSEGKIKRVSGWVNNLPTADLMWYLEVGPLQSPSQ